MHPLDISEDYVRHAISLAREARDAGDAPFGPCALIDGSAVLTARNTTITERDPTRTGNNFHRP